MNIFSNERGVVTVEAVVGIIILAVLAAAVWFYAQETPQNGDTPTPTPERLTEEQRNSEESQQFEQETGDETAEGPESSEENYSSTEAESGNTGSLELNVTDPSHAHGSPVVNNGSSGQNQGDSSANAGDEVETMVNQGNKPHTTPGAEQENMGGPVAMSSLVVNINRAEVHLAEEYKEDGSTEGVGTWETLDLNDTSADLIALKDAGGVLETLGVTDLVAGRYTQLRFFIDSATGVTEDGEEVTLELPDTSLKIVRTFEVKAGETTEVIVDFDAEKMAVKAGENYRLKPVVGRVIVEQEDQGEMEDNVEQEQEQEEDSE